MRVSQARSQPSCATARAVATTVALPANALRHLGARSRPAPTLRALLPSTAQPQRPSALATAAYRTDLAFLPIGSSACRSALEAAAPRPLPRPSVDWAQQRRWCNGAGSSSGFGGNGAWSNGGLAPRYDAYWPLPPPSALFGDGSDSDSSAEPDSLAPGPTAPPERVVTWWPPLPPALQPEAMSGAGFLSSGSTPSPSPSPAGAGGAVAEYDPFSMDLKQVAAAAAATAATAPNGGAATPAAAAPAAPGGKTDVDKSAPAVDVTRHNFQAMLPVVRRYLSACDFFAFDCEMTGLFLDGQYDNYLDDMQDRYTRTAAAAQSFIITQFGLSAFKRLLPDGPGGRRRYAAATFNFYLFPRPPEGGSAPASSAARRFTCDAGSLAFLASQGFDFNRCIYDGVPFMPVRQRDEALRQLGRDSDEDGASRGPDVALTQPQDIEFVEGLLNTVREWLAAPGGAPSGAPLDLPPVNRYQRLLAYQALARPSSFRAEGEGEGTDWHPGFYVRKVSDAGPTFLRLVPTPSREAARALAAADRAERRGAVEAAAGFAAVWEALRECGRPGVGHNCMFDVAYGVAQFGEGRLPATWAGFKGAVASWFRGGLYDTKHVARQLPSVLGSDTALGSVFGSLVPQAAGGGGAASPGSLPPGPGLLPANVEIRHAPGFEKYVDVEAGGCAHEAGYDAFMTGAVFAGLEELLGRVADLDPATTAPTRTPYASVVPFVWRLNVTRSDLPYALMRPAVPDDPTSQEPVPERPLVFHLGPLSPGVRANDIHGRCEAAGLGKVRITFLPGNNALIELGSVEAAAAVAAGALEGHGLCAEILPYTEYRARKDAALAAGTWPLPGYGGGGGGFGGGGGGARGPKRPRVEPAAEGAAAGAVTASAAADGGGGLRLAPSFRAAAAAAAAAAASLMTPPASPLGSPLPSLRGFGSGSIRETPSQPLPGAGSGSGSRPPVSPLLAIPSLRQRWPQRLPSLPRHPQPIAATAAAAGDAPMSDAGAAASGPVPMTPGGGAGTSTGAHGAGVGPVVPVSPGRNCSVM
ncbi:hypothetical protein HYH03_014327 [Edaphochlamys debaryana]|uniref:Uncharacterized protein n=1 Tax=Edaphochlamys debaryana TaxID=47281 RepID=A0A835XLL9_9CHLO|nr:hypothetical protein HYH03_014327 [Edaphochlamys debaryana]|eukprot:KAG2487082.1 hypothetical protein HYH03_014327 [Edaphochlamys debaryana]